MYHKIINNIECLNTVFDKVPKWLSENSDYIDEKLKTFNQDIINEYQIFHDCGKPYVLTIDENGRKHFPNHSQASHDTWLSMGGNEIVAKLMLKDMDMYTMKAVDIEKFMEFDHYLILMVTSVAELYANAEMFGGQSINKFQD